jgi:Transposase DDE domain
VADIKSEPWPASDRNRWPDSYWNAWPASSVFVGKELVQFRRAYATPRTGITAEGTCLYRAKDCDVCELKSRCCPNAIASEIPRDLHEDARDFAPALASTPEYEAACRCRKKIEMLFAQLKRILRLGRLRLWGAMWCQERIPSRGDRAELAAAREIEASECANGSNGGIAYAKAANAPQDSGPIQSIKNVTNGIRVAEPPSFSTVSARSRRSLIRSRAAGIDPTRIFD